MSNALTAICFSHIEMAKKLSWQLNLEQAHRRQDLLNTCIKEAWELRLKVNLEHRGFASL